MPTSLERLSQAGVKQTMNFDNTFSYGLGDTASIVDINMPPVLGDLTITYGGNSLMSFNRLDPASFLNFYVEVTDPHGSGVCDDLGCVYVVHPFPVHLSAVCMCVL